MMSLFASSSFEADVEKATNHKNTSEDWALIMEICDKVNNNPQNARDCLRSIMRRMQNQDPHIVMYAITLLDACSNNCGKVFHLEIASREFEGQFIKLINNSRNQPPIYNKLKQLIQKWAEGDYKSDPQLHLIPSLYQQLKAEHDFSNINEPLKKQHPMSKDPNVVTSAQEEEEIAKAIALSLKESSKQTPSISHTSSSTKKIQSLYPSVTSALLTTSSAEGRKVKALYDFEAAEDNELTFSAGEIINILDDSDPNWWKGSNHRGEGLFPSNFVTADLSVEPEQLPKMESNKKSVQFTEEVEVKTFKSQKEESTPSTVEINEEKMDRLMKLLHEADPQSNATDTEEMLILEDEVNAYGPRIDAFLEKIDKQHAQLTQISSDLVEAMNLYHTLMREPAISSYTSPKMPPQQMVYPYPHPQAGYPQGIHPQDLPNQGMHPQNMHPQGVRPQSGLPPGVHPQMMHPSAENAQGITPMGPLQGPLPHMFNGMHPSVQNAQGMSSMPTIPTGPQTQLIANPQDPANISGMTLPHHIQMPAALRQGLAEAHQDMHQANQNHKPHIKNFAEQDVAAASVPYMQLRQPGQSVSSQQAINYANKTTWSTNQ